MASRDLENIKTTMGIHNSNKGLKKKRHKMVARWIGVHTTQTSCVHTIQISGAHTIQMGCDKRVHNKPHLVHA